LFRYIYILGHLIVYMIVKDTYDCVTHKYMGPVFVPSEVSKQVDCYDMTYLTARRFCEGGELELGREWTEESISPDEMTALMYWSERK